MIGFTSTKKRVGIALLTVFLVGEIAVVSAGLFIPQQTQAALPGVGLTVPTSDIPTIWQRILIGIARTILEKFTDKFLRKFTDNLVNKYKIRNYLYYDRVLSDYYLTNFIMDNVSDPDLRETFLLLQQGYITGQHSYTNGPDPRKALIPKIKAKMAKIYIKQGGIEINKVYNPKRTVRDEEYFATARAYFANPKSFTEQNLRGEFGENQSAATTGSQLEIAVGNGLKAGRIIGGTCTNLPPPAVPNDYYNNPNTCVAAGGKWQASLVDQARSFIDNPTSFVSSNLDSAIRQHFENSFNPATDFWTRVGGLLGSFIWNKIALNKNNSQNGSLSDDPRGYQPDEMIPGPTNSAPSGSEIDIDGDGIFDGADADGDGVIDFCYFGGTAPNCTGSSGGNNGNSCDPNCVWAWIDAGGPTEKTGNWEADFFGTIGKTKGSPAPDWQQVLSSSGIPCASSTPGVQFDVLNQQCNSSSEPRGRVYAPTDTPDGNGYYFHVYDVLAPGP